LIKENHFSMLLLMQLKSLREPTVSC